jgi:DNA mismatch repair protein MutS
VLGIGYLNSIGADAAPLAVAAAGVVVEYLLANQVTLAPGLLRVRTYSVDAVMSLDSATAANLELQSLVKLVDRTVTAAGLRRLRSWIESPLREAESIELRLAAVDELVGNREFEEKLADALKPVGDLERMLARAAQGLAPPRELVALRRSLEALPALKGLAEDGRSLELRALAGRIEALADLAGSLRAALVDDPPATIREGGVIRPGFDPDLDAIHSASASSRQWINELEGRERERTGIRTLKAGYNRVFGYYLEVGHGQSAMVPADYIRKQTLAGAERYLTPELKEHEAIVLNAQHHAVTREGELLRTLQKLVTDAAASILSSAAASAELDALRSLASVARALAWTRPVISTGLELRLEGCRHPLVEASLPPATFVANDLDLDPDRAQIVILTGPNMAGKSTYLRQIALTVLLAQVGSFVPCREATIGLTDRIFTRIGAHDDLAAGMSTFMVEMTETASILNHATATSLVILDEVGRGTSTYDGVSIAQAVVEYLHESPRLRCRTLFATHYHELTALAETLPRVANYRMEVVEEGEEIRFLHQIVEGGADRSYGIHVAALAGLPAQLVARARQIMAELERERPLEPPEHQLKLDLPPGPNPIKDELSRIEVDHLTPLEALQKLYELRSRAQRS